ncbi:hypothetical protein HHI36_016462 [Cryptolaemus montrouzieri]|uniref:Uncharacterized protein n=1 Tax=Cryptolaemus montrouzieri TaxID=559131 RepID=A0ABD2NK84_9CUCU
MSLPVSCDKSIIGQKQKKSEDGSRKQKLQKTKPIKQLSETEESSSSNDEKENECKENVMPSLESPCKPRIGEYVIVCYDGSFFPGQVASIVGGDYLVDVVTPSGKTEWRLPDCKDDIWYDKVDIVKIIKTPKAVNARGVFAVEEMREHQWVIIRCS